MMMMIEILFLPEPQLELENYIKRITLYIVCYIQKPVARPTLVKPTGSRMVCWFSSKVYALSSHPIGSPQVWRDGQKKRVFVYRFLSTGTLEEKVFQRQLSKEGLKSAVSADADGVEL